jgi:uncharacterized protein with PhoU and TrkA domain
MTTSNIDLLLSDITFRNGIKAESVVVTVHNGDDTQFAVVALRDLIDEVRALREQRDALKTQLASARELMEEAANDIWYMVNAEYHGPDDVHPAMRAKYARDIEIVTRLTAALTQEDA